MRIPPALRRPLARAARAVLPVLAPELREVTLALAARAGHGPAVLPGVPAGPVAVIAPHPDDETIGCGATLARHAAAGDPVTVVVATSGEATGGGGRTVAAARERECEAACRTLGLGPPRFLRLPDGALPAAVPALAEALADLLRGAANVYLPHPLDPHPDHRAVNHAVAAAGLTADLLGYEVWATAPVDVVVDGALAWARKLDALRCYPVALESVDYVGAAEGLGAYRGITAGLGEGGRAEGFVRLPAAEHAALVRRLPA